MENFAWWNAPTVSWVDRTLGSRRKVFRTFWQESVKPRPSRYIGAINVFNKLVVFLNCVIWPRKRCRGYRQQPWEAGTMLWRLPMVASMRGCNSIIIDEPYAGTAKSAEGYLAGLLFKQAKSIGRTRIPHAKSHFMLFGKQTSTHVIKCGGHVGRAHGHALKDI